MVFAPVCLLILQIGLALRGLVQIILGRNPLRRSRNQPEPQKARQAGVVLMLPLPLAIGLAFGEIALLNALGESAQGAADIAVLVLNGVILAGALAFAETYGRAEQ
jgi:hypothetical protein